MATHLSINVKVPLPEGSIIDQGAALSNIKTHLDAFREGIGDHEFADKIVKSSGKPRAARGSKKTAASE